MEGRERPGWPRLRGLPMPRHYFGNVGPGTVAVPGKHRPYRRGRAKLTGERLARISHTTFAQ
jgi:hypothetical protein